VHAEIAWRSGYLPQATFAELDNAYEKVMGKIVKMMEQHEKWLIKPSPRT